MDSRFSAIAESTLAAAQLWRGLKYCYAPTQRLFLRRFVAVVVLGWISTRMERAS
jgi:hypothetical protein